MQYKTLEVEIYNMKDDIREIKLDNKETNKHFTDVVTALKENVIVQTELLKKTNELTELQFTQVKDEVGELRVEIKSTLNSQTKWYQEFLSTNTKRVLMILMVVITSLMGLKLANIDITKLLSFL